jgi:hypothetical protein
MVTKKAGEYSLEAHFKCQCRHKLFVALHRLSNKPKGLESGAPVPEVLEMFLSLLIKNLFEIYRLCCFAVKSWGGPKSVFCLVFSRAPHAYAEATQ